MLIKIRRSLSLSCQAFAQWLMLEHKLAHFFMALSRKLNPDPAAEPDFVKAVKGRYSR